MPSLYIGFIVVSIVSGTEPRFAMHVQDELPGQLKNNIEAYFSNYTLFEIN